jgi:F-type H+-transporting ATPase subunit b
MLKLDWNIIFNIINIMVLYVLMKKFLFGPITEIMEKRSKTIADSITDAEEKSSAAQELKLKYEDILKDAEVMADRIVKEAKQSALKVQEKQIEETKAEIAKMMEDANKSIELERQKSMQNIQSEIAGIAMTAAAKILQKNMDETANMQIMNDFFAKAGVNK